MQSNHYESILNIKHAVLITINEKEICVFIHLKPKISCNLYISKSVNLLPTMKNFSVFLGHSFQFKYSAGKSQLKVVSFIRIYIAKM